MLIIRYNQKLDMIDECDNKKMWCHDLFFRNINDVDVF